LQYNLLKRSSGCIPETLSDTLLKRYQLLDRTSALRNIHFPKDSTLLQQACFRLKFEELLFLQLQLLQLRQKSVKQRPGKVLQNTQLLRRFYVYGLPFTLTRAQKRVVREIYRDLRSANQMNRLVQGDVGSGKTVVALLSMLICVGSDAQVALMVPTELLATQHYQGLQALIQSIPVAIELLTSATKQSKRREILHDLQVGRLKIVVGTHALLHDSITFYNLGLVIIDEQHRFGVVQRAKLWAKQQDHFPHVLVMTATPIPRTLAMTLYGDLDLSVIDEMPAGRKPIKTLHYYDTQRLSVFRLLREQMAMGRQVYIVYPLIEESRKMDYNNLLDGYESVCRAFPEFTIGILHGQMQAADKAYEMRRFVKGKTQLMVATTVVEVGVDVPNATVIVIENAERFGLAQLHQLRGRVGRGREQAYCILMSSVRLTSKSRERIQTMVNTCDGFEIADADLKLRGPGDLLGIQQSGVLNLKIANLTTDGHILQTARAAAQSVLQEDPTLTLPKHRTLKTRLAYLQGQVGHWSNVG